METDPRGQLGGLECSDAVRRRMASESSGWKCTSCGRTNEEILKACEEAAGNVEGGVKADEEVPKELTMFEKGPGQGESSNGLDGSKNVDSEETAELAEGFVQTAPFSADEPSASTSGASYPPARPAQTVPQPTATITTHPPRQPVMAVRARRSNDGVPLWIDRTIAGVVVCLIFMVLKMLLGF